MKLRNNLWVWAIPLVLLILLRIPSLFESFWYGDEAIYAAVAEEISRGKDLYAAAWDHKPPLIFWIFYPGALLRWGMGLPFLRFINIILGVLTLVFVYTVLTREKIKATSKMLAMLFLSFFLGSTVLEGNIMNAEVIFIAFNMAAFYLLYQKKHFVLVGVLAFLSLVTKVPGFVEFAAFCAAFFVIYAKEKGLLYLPKIVVKLAVGFIIPLVVVISAFYLSGTLSDFVYANATFNGIYSSQQGSYTPIIAFSLISVFMLSTVLFWAKKISSFYYLAIVLFAAEVFASLLSAKNYAHYFLQILPGATLLIALYLQNLGTKVKTSQIAIAAVFAILLVPAGYVFTRGGEISIFAKPQEYYSWFFKGYVLGDQTYKEKFWWANGAGPEQVKSSSSFLNSNYLDINPVYIYTDKPWIIANSDREFTNKYVVWFHLAYLPAHLAEDLENMKSANLFVYDTGAQLLPEVEELLKDSFVKIDEYENLQIYEKLN